LFIPKGESMATIKQLQRNLEIKKAKIAKLSAQLKEEKEAKQKIVDELASLKSVVKPAAKAVAKPVAKKPVAKKK
jgi:hypothetical protein